MTLFDRLLKQRAPERVDVRLPDGTLVLRFWPAGEGPGRETLVELAVFAEQSARARGFDGDLADLRLDVAAAERREAA